MPPLARAPLPRVLLLLGALAAASGCTGCEDPEARVREAYAALAAGDVAAVEALIHPDYSDPAGDRAALVAALPELARDGVRPELRELEVLRGPSGPAVIGTLELRLAGPPEWTVLGPLRVELAPHDGRLRVRSGYLDDLRDLRALFAARRAALEANDADALGALLHPEYQDGTLDKAQAVARLRTDLAGVPLRIEPRSYWAEVRGLDTHVDERYGLRVGEATHAAIARLTLRRAAGHWRIRAGLYPPGQDRPPPTTP